MTPRDAFKGIAQDLERRHELHRGFFATLLKQNDWSFVIQCHSLIEAALGDALTHRAHTQSLRALFDQLPTSDARTGKVAFAEAYGLLSKDQGHFVRFMSTLRNSLVHRISNVGFTFRDHMAVLEANPPRSYAAGSKA